LLPCFLIGISENQNMPESQSQMMIIEHTEEALADSRENSLALHQTLGPKGTKSLQRMFRDPRVLESHERNDLIASLSQAVELLPSFPEVRVMFGMALCVDLRVQEAMTHLREAVEQNPHCYIAQLKLGELLMRLRICDQAADHTHQAALLAENDVQADLARRQAAAIRQMRREGIERGGYKGLLSWAKTFSRRRTIRSSQPALAASE
jgi:Flp pilus assembly protein TadD